MFDLPLYQLSYPGEPETGFEPATYWLWITDSLWLAPFLCSDTNKGYLDRMSG